MIRGAPIVDARPWPSSESKERTMLSAMYGLMSMLPITFGIAGYALVSRH
jgi:hypothetical protein